MRIFLSYSTPDTSLVEAVAEHLRPHADLYFWSESNMPGENAWQSIFDWIDSSDLVIVLITDNTVRRAMAVGNEVGRARAKLKTIVPLVSSTVSKSELGCLEGITYQAIDPSNPGSALSRIASIVQSRREKLERDQGLVLLLGLVGFIWLASQK